MSFKFKCSIQVSACKFGNLSLFLSWDERWLRRCDRTTLCQCTQVCGCRAPCVQAVHRVWSGHKYYLKHLDWTELACPVPVGPIRLRSSIHRCSAEGSPAVLCFQRGTAPAQITLHLPFLLYPLFSVIDNIHFYLKSEIKPTTALTERVTAFHVSFTYSNWEKQTRAFTLRTHGIHL